MVERTSTTPSNTIKARSGASFVLPIFVACFCSLVASFVGFVTAATITRILGFFFLHFVASAAVLLRLLLLRLADVFMAERTAVFLLRLLAGVFMTECAAALLFWLLLLLLADVFMAKRATVLSFGCFARFVRFV